VAETAQYWLTLLIAIPAVGFIVTLVATKTLRHARAVALAFSLAQLVLASLLLLDWLTAGGGSQGALYPLFEAGDPPLTLAGTSGDTAVEATLVPRSGDFAYLESYEWVPRLGMRFQLGVDGLSLPLVFLTPLLVTLSIVFQWDEKHRSKEFYALLLLMGATVAGVFMALDFFLFAIFWELVLIPMFLLIGIWGGPRKRYAAIKFLIYTHVGFAIMLLSIFAVYLNVTPGLQASLWARTGDPTTVTFRPTFDMRIILEAMGDPLTRGAFVLSLQIPAFIAFFFGFGVKLPMVPFHTWLPDAHVEAPTAGSVLLAGVLLKMGGYGIFRVALPMMPDAARELWWVLAVFGSVSMIYASFVCLPQVDLKRLIAYSSIGHMGFVLLGASSLNRVGIAGGAFQLFNHGLITAVLFMLAGSVKHATGTRDIPDLRGLATKLPMFSLVLIIGTLASLGLPGLNGFVSEFMVFAGFYSGPELPAGAAPLLPWRALIIIPLLAVAITGAYYLWMLHRMLFGTFNAALGEVHDLPRHELAAYLVLCGLIVWVGLYPTLFLEPFWRASEGLAGLWRGP